MNSASKVRGWTFAVLLFLCVSVNVFALEREAFSIRNYDLKLQIDPEQHRLGVRGKVTLRNDSTTAQKVAVLQISSSLDWRAIKVSDKPWQFVTQPYASDIDHTGALSEAIVTLPQAVDPHGLIELEIAYEGVILLDATRLTRIGTPEEVAKSSDWDQIAPNFTGMRGAGYVAWYPIATEVANLSEGNTLDEVLTRWKAREAGANFHLIVDPTNLQEDLGTILLNGVVCRGEPKWDVMGHVNWQKMHSSDCLNQPQLLDVPTLVIAKYARLTKPGVDVSYLPGHETAASNYADSVNRVLPLITEWFGPPHQTAHTADLPDPQAAPFESGALLLMPLANTDPTLGGLAAAHQLTHASFVSFRPWIEEGLAHFAQALYLEQEKNRQAALDYMGVHRAAFLRAEKAESADGSEQQTQNSLVNTTTEELYRSKAMYVWWMLRDMIGEGSLKKAIAAYRPEQDKEASYMPRLIQAQTQRDLEWFFDDWVYRDRGLPDFKVESAFARKTLSNGYMVTITVNNLGATGAEVPVEVRFAGGESSKKLEVRAKDKATIRVEVPSAPTDILVNDGSVPESEFGNNSYKVQAGAPASATDSSPR